MASVRAARWLFALVLAFATASAIACLVEVSDLPERAEDGSASGDASNDASPGTRDLGDRCDAVERCLSGLECLAADAKPVGIAGGLCTKRCTRDDQCPAYAMCIPDIPAGSGKSACLEKCTFGDGDRRKCHGRRDLACFPQLAGPPVVSACLPGCNRDENCPPGRACNQQYGQCTDAPREGGAPLSSCDASTDCRGVCLASRCAEFCTIGAPGSCGADPTWGFELACVPFEDGKEGDVTQCMRECVCHAQCGQLNCVVVRGAKLFCGKSASVPTLPPCP